METDLAGRERCSTVGCFASARTSARVWRQPSRCGRQGQMRLSWRKTLPVTTTRLAQGKTRTIAERQRRACWQKVADLKLRIFFFFFVAPWLSDLMHFAIAEKNQPIITSRKRQMASTPRRRRPMSSPGLGPTGDATDDPHTPPGSSSPMVCHPFCLHGLACSAVGPILGPPADPCLTGAPLPPSIPSLRDDQAPRDHGLRRQGIFWRPAATSHRRPTYFRAGGGKRSCRRSSDSTPPSRTVSTALRS